MDKVHPRDRSAGRALRDGKVGSKEETKTPLVIRRGGEVTGQC